MEDAVDCKVWECICGWVMAVVVVVVVVMHRRNEERRNGEGPVARRRMRVEIGIFGGTEDGGDEMVVVVVVMEDSVAVVIEGDDCSQFAGFAGVDGLVESASIRVMEPSRRPAGFLRIASKSA